MKNNIEKTDLNKLITNLKKKDNKYAKISRVLQYIYWVILPLFIILLYSEYKDGFKWTAVIGSILYCIAIVTIALMLGKNYKKYISVDYSLPTLLVLKNAVKRYSLFYGKKPFLMTLISLFETGTFLRKMGEPDWLHFQLLITLAMSVGLFIGFHRWRIFYKPLRKNAKKLIQEIEGE